MVRYKTLRIITPTTYEDEIEAEIKALFLEELYKPIIMELGYKPSSVIRNARSSLLESIRRGTVSYRDGVFSGQFSAAISKELKGLGATFSKRDNVWRLKIADLPYDVQATVGAFEAQYQKRIDAINRKLDAIDPQALADKLKSKKWFDKAIHKTDGDLVESLNRITIVPNLSPEEKERFISQYQQSLNLRIVDFTRKETQKLRDKMTASVFAGNRFESAIDSIRKSYGVAAEKAAFLASQETRLATAKLKEIRYQSAGVDNYRWKCVTGSPEHPVRKMHKELNDRSDKGEVFQFSNPPIDDPNGSRHNPSENYRCRCTAIAVVAF